MSNQLKIDEIEKTVLPNIKQKIEHTTRQLENAEGNLEDSQEQMGWTERLNPFNENKETIDEKQRISSLNEQIKIMQTDMEENEKLVDQLREEIVGQ